MKAHPRSACGASPSRGSTQRPGKAGSAVALEEMNVVSKAEACFVKEESWVK